MSQAKGSSGSVFARPVDAVADALLRVPGAQRAEQAVNGALDQIGAVSPRARRVVAYTGVGVLGVAGVVEWPVAAAGAALVWLTRPRDDALAQTPTPTAAKRVRSSTDASGGPEPAKSAKPAKRASGVATRTRAASTSAPAPTAPAPSVTAPVARRKRSKAPGASSTAPRGAAEA